ncbi:MAG: hypothetical protein ACK5UQ_06850 [Planctomycetota bacterium]|jgi:hypothetical protein
MADEAQRFPGRLLVAEQPRWSYENLFARFGIFGLRLPRLEPGTHRIATDGPHLTLDCVNALFFVNAIHAVRKPRLEYDYAGESLGQIDLLSGYAAHDLGTETFPVTKLSLRIDIAREEMCFSIAGQCGPGLPWSFASGRPRAGPTRFEATFSVADASLPDFFEQAEHVAAFERNRASYLFGA